jgi:signal transduction histidine kinase
MKMSEEKSEQEHYMHLMQDRIKRLEKIISEISMYVKSAKGKPIQKPFFLKELVNEVWAELEFMEGAYRITFAADIEDTFEIQSDRDRWKIVLSNLITNAIKYHDQKKEDPFIKISVIKEDQTIKVLVSDNGQGIEPKYQDRLFEMFYRATDASQGTGLGLFLVKKVVDSLRGTIQLQSDFKVGTRVEIAIPLAA